MTRPIHPDFLHYLEFKEEELIFLFEDLRSFLLELVPECNELLYHTHALTAVFSHSAKLSDAFCHIPIYNEHLNLGFNKGAILPDPDQLLQGTGKLIRHIPIQQKEDYRNPKAGYLIRTAIQFALEEMKKPAKEQGMTISKIKLGQ